MAPACVLVTDTSPPRRLHTSRVSARPIPRSPPCAALVVNPCENTSCASSGATPGPESRTTISTLEASWRSSTSTQASWSSPALEPLAAASTALSTRLPSTVATSAESVGSSRSSAVRSEIFNRTLRSAARADLAMSSAATARSRTRLVRFRSSDSRCLRRARTYRTTSSCSPIWMSPEMVCSWLENSWACARSSSVVLRKEPNSRSSWASSVRSRRVVTEPRRRPSLVTSIRFITRTRPRRTTTSSRRARSPGSPSGAVPARTSYSRPSIPRSVRLIPTASGRSRSLRPTELTSVSRCCGSRATTPSAIPNSIASRCSASPAISRGSMPKVCRLIRRASSQEPATPRTLATPR